MGLYITTPRLNTMVGVDTVVHLMIPAQTHTLQALADELGGGTNGAGLAMTCTGATCIRLMKEKIKNKSVYRVVFRSKTLHSPLRCTTSTIHSPSP